MLDEFKKFAIRGNVVDLAVGVIIGAAFGAIVTSMVGDVIMPVIGAVSGGLDFSNYYVPLNEAVKTGMPLADAKKAGAVLAYAVLLRRRSISSSSPLFFFLPFKASTE